MTNRFRRLRPTATTIVAAAVLVVSRSVDAQTQATASKSKPHVVALASEEFGGRLAGSPGERLAASYIVTALQRIGAKPLPGQTDYRLPFEFTAGTRDGGSSVELRCAQPAAPPTGAGNPCETRTYSGMRNIQALSFSDNGTAEGPVVFAGYGIVLPDNQGFGYDSYATINVKDKMVLVLRYFPEDADPKSKAVFARYANLRFKAMAARQRGARGLIVVTGPRSPNAGETIAMSFDTALAGSGIVAGSVSGEIGEALMRSTGKTLAEVQKGLDSGNPHVAGFEIPGVSVSLTSAVVREKQSSANIAAYLPATVPLGTRPKPWIAIGAHYDHLGRGDHGHSLANKDEAGKIHFGADDNASGSAAVLALGEILASQPRQRHVMLEFWSGEELGLIGSNSFVNNPPVPLDQVAAYLNFDMVGRMQDNKLQVQAAGTSPAWARIIEQANVAAGFDLSVQTDPYQPTDVASFNQANVPCLNFFTGTHTDYHRPSDTADKIDYEGLDRIVDFAATIVRRLGETTEPPLFTKVEQLAAPGGGRADVRVFTGTIPDYADDAKGLLLSGVVGGGPADQAGLQKGDVIVEIAGQTIANIYDYTYALEVLKIGEPAKVVYLRNGERKETTLTPAARK
jgi:hypothetical protein